MVAFSFAERLPIHASILRRFSTTSRARSSGRPLPTLSRRRQKTRRAVCSAAEQLYRSELTSATFAASSFIQTTLSTGYPRLLRLFQEFFSQIAVHTDTVYTLAQQSPETVLVLRAIQPFETLYLTRSTNRLTEAVTSAFSLSSSLTPSFSARPPTVPTANEGLTTARSIVNELDAARFDPLLVRAVAKGAARAIDTFVNRSEGLVRLLSAPSPSPCTR